jgi:hypothetical protein
VSLFPAGFLFYSVVAVGLILWLIFWVSPEHGQENVLVYLGICSLAGSFTVTSCKVRTQCGVFGGLEAVEQRVGFARQPVLVMLRWLGACKASAMRGVGVLVLQEGAVQ